MARSISASLAPGRFPSALATVERRSSEGLAGLPVGPRAYAVVQTHSYAHDREWVRHLIEAGVAYVGLLGPRARGTKILAEIGVDGADESLRDRVFTPVGLDLGAEGAEQVALSIVAELLAVRSSREPASLRGRESAIHA